MIEKKIHGYVIDYAQVGYVMHEWNLGNEISYVHVLVEQRSEKQSQQYLHGQELWSGKQDRILRVYTHNISLLDYR